MSKKFLTLFALVALLVAAMAGTAFAANDFEAVALLADDANNLGEFDGTVAAGYTAEAYYVGDPGELIFKLEGEIKEIVPGGVAGMVVSLDAEIVANDDTNINGVLTMVSSTATGGAVGNKPVSTFSVTDWDPADGDIKLKLKWNADTVEALPDTETTLTITPKQYGVAFTNTNPIATYALSTLAPDDATFALGEVGEVVVMDAADWDFDATVAFKATTDIAVGADGKATFNATTATQGIIATLDDTNKKITFAVAATDSGVYRAAPYALGFTAGDITFDDSNAIEVHVAGVAAADPLAQVNVAVNAPALTAAPTTTEFTVGTAGTSEVKVTNTDAANPVFADGKTVDFYYSVDGAGAQQVTPDGTTQIPNTGLTFNNYGAFDQGEVSAIATFDATAALLLPDAGRVVSIWAQGTEPNPGPTYKSLPFTFTIKPNLGVEFVDQATNAAVIPTYYMGQTFNTITVKVEPILGYDVNSPVTIARDDVNSTIATFTATPTINNGEFEIAGTTTEVGAVSWDITVGTTEGATLKGNLILTVGATPDFALTFEQADGTAIPSYVDNQTFTTLNLKAKNSVPFSVNVLSFTATADSNVTLSNDLRPADGGNNDGTFTITNNAAGGALTAGTVSWDVIATTDAPETLKGTLVLKVTEFVPGPVVNESLTLDKTAPAGEYRRAQGETTVKIDETVTITLASADFFGTLAAPTRSFVIVGTPNEALSNDELFKWDADDTLKFAISGDATGVGTITYKPVLTYVDGTDTYVVSSDADDGKFTLTVEEALPATGDLKFSIPTITKDEDKTLEFATDRVKVTVSGDATDAVTITNVKLVDASGDVVAISTDIEVLWGANDSLSDDVFALSADTLLPGFVTYEITAEAASGKELTPGQFKVTINAIVPPGPIDDPIIVEPEAVTDEKTLEELNPSIDLLPPTAYTLATATLEAETSDDVLASNYNATFALDSVLVEVNDVSPDKAIALKLVVPEDKSEVLAAILDLPTDERVKQLEISMDVYYDYVKADRTPRTDIKSAHVIGSGGYVTWDKAVTDGIAVLNTSNGELDINYIVVNGIGNPTTAGKYLVIYDNTADNSIVDPLVVTHRKAGTYHSSSSGCDAGLGAFALLGLAGLALLRKKD